MLVQAHQPKGCEQRTALEHGLICKTQKESIHQKNQKAISGTIPLLYQISPSWETPKNNCNIAPCYIKE
jgi:hypothetical protein